MPEEWAWCRLRNIGEYKKGPFGSSLTKAMFVPKSENTVKVYEQKNAIQKDHSLGEYYITRDYFESQMQSFEVFPGDILVSCAGTIGETYILPDNIEQGIINQALMKMKITSLINTDYFLMFFDHILKEESANNGKGTAIKNIPPFDIFKNFLFPLPSYSEQKRIIESVNNIFSIIDNLENNKSDLQSLIKNTKSKILDLAIHGKLVPQDQKDEPAEELLKRIATSDNRPYEKVEEEPFEIPDSWKWVKLGDIGQTNIGLTYHPNDISNTGISVLRSNNIQNDKLCFDDVVKVNPNTKILNNQYINNGDILICARNGSQSLVGKCVLINNLREKTSFGAFMAVFRSHCNQYILKYLQSKYFKDYMFESNSTQIHQLTQSMLKDALIPFPPEKEQVRIVAKIDELYSQLDQIQTNLV